MLNLEQQVCSLELAKKLKALNVKQESLFVHLKTKHAKGIYYSTDTIRALLADAEWCSAFTSSELGEMLPLEMQGFDLTKVDEGDDKGWKWEVARHINHDADFCGFEKTEADARAKMLIHLIENSLIPLPING